MTSHDVVSVLRRIYPGEKIGHCGTLDPNAAGVLPVGVGRGVKFSQWLLKDKKTYIAKINFGKKTETMDCYGEVISTSYINDFSDDKLNEVLNSFLGNHRRRNQHFIRHRIGKFSEIRHHIVFTCQISVQKVGKCRHGIYYTAY